MDLNRIINALSLAALAVLVGTSFLFKVDETQHALLFQFGEVVKTEFEPGLHFKVPVINEVRKYDDRVLTLDNRAEEFLTGEKKVVEVDFFVKWRIADVGQYYQSTSGDEEIAAGRLAEIVKDGLKGVIAKRTIQQVVAAERSEFIGDILQFAGQSVGQLGITLVDVRVKRIDLPDEVSDSVFRRMAQDFARQAAQLRAEGAESAERIRAEAERQRTETLSTATREADKVRGEGDAKAAEIYARAYQRNPEFYAFYRSMQAYRKSLGQPNDLMVIAPEGEFFKYLKQPAR